MQCEIKFVVLLKEPGISAVNHILIKCSQNLRPVRTGLTTGVIIFETLPPVAIPLRCPACGHVHRWKPEDAWVAHVPMDSTSKSWAQINKSPDVRKANGARMWQRY